MSPIAPNGAVRGAGALPLSACDSSKTRVPESTARRPETPAGATALLLQRGADLVEHVADVRAYQLDCDDDEHRNQARNQRIFDRRHTGFIAKEVSNSKHMGFS